MINELIKLNRNGEVLNNNMMPKSKPASSFNVTKHRNRKGVSQSENKPERKTDQKGVYKI